MIIISGKTTRKETKQKSIYKGKNKTRQGSNKLEPEFERLENSVKFSNIDSCQ